jgi:hypothetical protein
LEKKSPRVGDTLGRLSRFIGIMQSEDPNHAIHATLLPDDLAACHSLISQLAQTISAQNRTIQEQQLTINELIERAFRHRSERYVADPNQLKLDFGNTPEAADAAAGLAEAVEEAEILVAAYKRRKRVRKKPRSEQLPAHLPVTKSRPRCPRR